MKLITRYTDYAIRALLYMVKEQESVSVSELVEELKIPRAFLRMILQILGRKKILKSQRGKGGGFILALSPNRISLLDLIEVFQGPLRLNECVFKRNLCPNVKNCKIKKKIDAIQKYVKSELRDVTLKSILKGE